MADIRWESCRYTDDVPEWIRRTCAHFAMMNKCSVTIKKEIATLYMDDGTEQHEESYVARVKRDRGFVSVSMEVGLARVTDQDLLEIELRSALRQVSIEP